MDKPSKYILLAIAVLVIIVWAWHIGAVRPFLEGVQHGMDTGAGYRRY